MENHYALNLNSFDVNLGKNIQTARKLLNISLESLAETLDLTPGYMGLIERGMRGVKARNLPILSKVLCISIDDLLAFSE